MLRPEGNIEIIKWFSPLGDTFCGAYKAMC
jgi:hypothetical protein